MLNLPIVKWKLTRIWIKKISRFEQFIVFKNKWVFSTESWLQLKNFIVSCKISIYKGWMMKRDGECEKMQKKKNEKDPLSLKALNENCME